MAFSVMGLERVDLAFLWAFSHCVRLQKLPIRKAGGRFQGSFLLGHLMRVVFLHLYDHSVVATPTFTPMFTSHSHSEGWQKAGPESPEGFFLRLN